MKNDIQEKAYAKLNLSLDVTGKREDGYHEVCMVMQSVDLCDEVRIQITEDGVFRSKSNRGYIPNDERNVAVKAAMVFNEAYDLGGRGEIGRAHV